MINDKEEAQSFDNLGIAPSLLKIMGEIGFRTPTPIQAQSIPVSLKGKDIVGIAQTGTGKTLAFGVPMIQLLATHKGIGLVVLPTRELAQQVEDNLRVLGEKINLRTAVLIGGVPIAGQLRTLKKNPHIIIATPGRLIEHSEKKTVNLGRVKVLVLDEADMMLDMGFLPQVNKILDQVPKERQTMLFSATMPAEIVRIASKYMQLPLRIEVAPAGTSAKNVEQEMLVMAAENKLVHLKKLLNQGEGKVLIFAMTKRIVKKLTERLVKQGFTAVEIHSNKSQGQRKKALAGFKSGEFRIMVATDIAARGIDVSGIELVINYDLPVRCEDYVHRIGRTARAGKSGKAVSLVLPNQLKDVKTIERLISKSIKLTRIATDPSVPSEVLDVRRTRGGGGARFSRNNTAGRKPGPKKTGGFQGRPRVGANSPAKAGGRPSRSGSNRSSRSPMTSRRRYSK